MNVIMSYEEWLIEMKDAIQSCYLESNIRFCCDLDDYLTDRFNAYLNQFKPVSLN